MTLALAPCDYMRTRCSTSCSCAGAALTPNQFPLAVSHDRDDLFKYSWWGPVPDWYCNSKPHGRPCAFVSALGLLQTPAQGFMPRHRKFISPRTLEKETDVKSMKPSLLPHFYNQDPSKVSSSDPSKCSVTHPLSVNHPCFSYNL